LVKGLDSGQLVDVSETSGLDLPFRQRVEHERVVGIRAVGDVDGFSHELFSGKSGESGRSGRLPLTFRSYPWSRRFRLRFEFLQYRIMLQIFDFLLVHFT